MSKPKGIRSDIWNRGLNLINPKSCLEISKGSNDSFSIPKKGFKTCLLCRDRVPTEWEHSMSAATIDRMLKETNNSSLMVFHHEIDSPSQLLKKSRPQGHALHWGMPHKDICTKCNKTFSLLCDNEFPNFVVKAYNNKINSDVVECPILAKQYIVKHMLYFYFYYSMSISEGACYDLKPSTLKSDVDGILNDPTLCSLSKKKKIVRKYAVVAPSMEEVYIANLQSLAICGKGEDGFITTHQYVYKVLRALFFNPFAKFTNGKLMMDMLMVGTRFDKDPLRYTYDVGYKPDRYLKQHYNKIIGTSCLMPQEHPFLAYKMYWFDMDIIVAFILPGQSAPKPEILNNIERKPKFKPSNKESKTLNHICFG